MNRLQIGFRSADCSPGGLSEDGKTLCLDITTKKDETFSVAFKPNDAAKFVRHILSIAQEAAAKQTPEMKSGVALVHPIDTPGIGVAQGRLPSEAILSIPIGPLTLTFAIELSVLMEQLEKLRSMTAKTSKPQKLN